MSRVTASNDLARYYNTNAKPQPIVLYMRPEAKAKMDLYVRLINKEVGWMGFIDVYQRHDEEHNIDIPGLLVLEDVFLYEQVVSGGSVDSGIKENIDISVILQELVERGEADKANQLRFFAHSHVNMGAYHSTTDTDMIDDWAATGLDWFISHVQNKKGEVDVRFDMFLPFRVSVDVEEVVISNNELVETVEQEIESKVSEKKWPQTTHKSNTKRNSQHKGSSGSSNGSTFRGPGSGRVMSGDAKAQIKNSERRYANNLGTPDNPEVKYRKSVLDGEEVQIRQEIVYGIIIHEAIVGSPSARNRMDLTTAEKWAYYREYVSENPSLTDPTPEQLEAHDKEEKKELTKSSRSIQRSMTKKDQEKESPGTSNPDSKTEEDSQTQTPESHKKEDEGSKKENKEKSSPDSKDKKGKQLVLAEGEKEDEVSSESDSDTSIKDQVEKAAEDMGLAI